MTLIQFFKKYQYQFMNGSLRLLQWAMKTLPRRLIEFFMEGLFSIASLGTKRLNNICAKNLQLVYGNSKNRMEYQEMAQRNLKSIGYSMMDLLYYVDRPKELSKIVHFQHEDHLKKTLELKRGAIAVSAHLSNFPLMFVSLVQKGYKVNVIIRSMRNENFSKFMYHLCGKWGINMIQTAPRKEFLRESLGALKRNELLFFLLDEAAPKESGIKVKFFNREVTRSIGPILFLERTASPILPMFIAQDERKHFKIFIEPSFELYEKGSKQENITKNITGLTNIIERFVNQYPLQWGGWFNKRWTLE